MQLECPLHERDLLGFIGMENCMVNITSDLYLFLQIECPLHEKNIHMLNVARAAWILLIAFMGIYAIKEILKVGIKILNCTYSTGHWILKYFDL